MFHRMRLCSFPIAILTLFVGPPMQMVRASGLKTYSPAPAGPSVVRTGSGAGLTATVTVSSSYPSNPACPAGTFDCGKPIKVEVVVNQGTGTLYQLQYIVQTATKPPFTYQDTAGIGFSPAPPPSVVTGTTYFTAPSVATGSGGAPYNVTVTITSTTGASFTITVPIIVCC